jgi:tRNA(Ile)-lysidine synthase
MLTVESFKTLLLTRCGYRPGDPVLAGVSGGLDSVVLCRLLKKAGIPFAIAHVNYGLRGEEAEGDEAFVAKLAEQLHVPFYLKVCSPADFESSGEHSVQAAARRIRYDFFAEVARAEDYPNIAIAHHSGDAIETALLNLARGTGIKGLTGIRYVNGKLIRPLLKFTRNEILDFALAEQLQWREDSSNDSDSYTRNRFRHHVLPWISEEIPQTHEGFAASFRKLKETEELLEASIDHWEQSCVSPEKKTGSRKISRSRMEKFPRPLHFLKFYLKRFGFSDAQLESLEPLSQQEHRTELYSATHRLIIEQEHYFLAETVSGEAPEFSLKTEPVPASGPFPDGTTEALIDSSLLPEKLQLRPWKHGEKMIPFGMKGHRLVSDILNDLKLPLLEKEKALVVVSGDEIVWIPGYRIAEKFKVTGQTRTALKLSIEKK